MSFNCFHFLLNILQYYNCYALNTNSNFYKIPKSTLDVNGSPFGGEYDPLIKSFSKCAEKCIEIECSSFYLEKYTGCNWYNYKPEARLECANFESDFYIAEWSMPG